MSQRVHFINRVVFVILFLWSALMLGTILLNVLHNYQYAESLAKNEAVVSVKKDLAYRSWVASHGGVYVPVTKRTPPNPYLSHLKNRDVHTNAGMSLTLMNPAYTLSQMMKDYTDLYGTKGHITSRVLMNPKNEPDAWEERVLEQAEITGEPYSNLEYIGDEKYFRYLKPLVMIPSCLKCHAFQGYKVGDVRGGVSVSVPMSKYYNDALTNSYINASMSLFIYLLGLLVIFYGRKKVKKALERKIKDYEQHIFSLVSIIEKRDSYTAGHTQRVAKYSVLIAKEMGLNEEKIDELYRACMLHDIGKISTPDSILLKPGKLTNLEYEIIKEHVVVSYELLNKVDIYKDIAEIVRHHHEHYDGRGYPQGLKGDEIPIISQIMTVADAFDAMTTNRIYKGRKSVEVALEELEILAGKQFNRQIVNAASIALSSIEVELSITQRPQTKIERARFAYFYKDNITDAYNQEYLDFVLAYNHTDEFDMQYISSINLHNFGQYNKNNSWTKGNRLLAIFTETLRSSLKSEYVFRIYGDDFIVLTKQYCEFEKYRETIEKVLEGSGVSVACHRYDIKEQKIKTFEDLEKLLSTSHS